MDDEDQTRPAAGDVVAADEPPQELSEPAPAAPPSRRVWFAACLGVVILLGVGVAVVALRGQPAAVPASARPAPSSMSRSMSPSSLSSSPVVAEDPDVRLARLRAAAARALDRVVAGATLGPGDDTFELDSTIDLGSTPGTQVTWPPPPVWATFRPQDLVGHVRGFQILGLVRANGRLGALNLRVGRGDPNVTCDGFTPRACAITTGPGGEKVRAIEFDRPVNAGQPSDIEIRMLIYRPNGSWVDASIDNAVAPFSRENITEVRTHTGDEPPLTIEQAKAFISDPALDECATACAVKR